MAESAECHERPSAKTDKRQQRLSGGVHWVKRSVPEIPSNEGLLHRSGLASAEQHQRNINLWVIAEATHTHTSEEANKSGAVHKGASNERQVLEWTSVGECRDGRGTKPVERRGGGALKKPNTPSTGAAELEASSAS